MIFRDKNDFENLNLAKELNKKTIIEKYIDEFSNRRRKALASF